MFRIVQEALTNIVKHSQSRTARICLKFTPSVIAGDIEDDGVGFEFDKVRRSRNNRMGLLGMLERIELIKGKMDIESEPRKGARIHFEIPRQENGG